MLLATSEQANYEEAVNAQAIKALPLDLSSRELGTSHQLLQLTALLQSNSAGLATQVRQAADLAFTQEGESLLRHQVATGSSWRFLQHCVT